MGFSESISTCLRKYATFSGRATRSEYWWFYLFFALTTMGVWIVFSILIGFGNPIVENFTSILSLAFILPVYAAGSRRLHDIGKSGWWQLILLVPLIGFILLIVWFATDTKPAGDKYNEITTS